jgi:hypothetical protein
VITLDNSASLGEAGPAPSYPRPVLPGYHPHQVGVVPQSKMFPSHPGPGYLVITPFFHQVGVVPQSKVQLWIDASLPGDLQAAYDLLHQQSAEDRTGKPRRTVES